MPGWPLEQPRHARFLTFGRPPLRFVSTRRRGVHAALLFVPHRDPLRLLPPRAAPDASGFALAGGGDRCRAGLRPSRPAGVPTHGTFPPVPDHLMATATPSPAPRPRARRFAPAARRHVARRRACLGRASPPLCERHEWAWRLPPPRGEGGKHHACIVPESESTSPVSQ